MTRSGWEQLDADGAPMIIDTDAGGDPDDAVALVVAARHVGALALVLTCDERDGQRARFVRLLLDQAGRTDVRVVAGRALGSGTAFCVADLIPDGLPAQPGDAVATAAALCQATTGPVRWVGMGPMSNLADLLERHPELTGRLLVTQMGGAVAYRDPQRAEHNIRLDPAAASTALSAVHRPYLVTSDVTFRPEMELRRDSPAYDLLSAAGAPVWAATLRAHLDRWFAQYHDASMQHDALTLSSALRLPFVSFDLRDVAFDEIGRMTAAAHRGGPHGVLVSRAADYAAFKRWLESCLGAAHAAATVSSATSPSTTPTGST